jgi:TonB family protein
MPLVSSAIRLAGLVCLAVAACLSQDADIADALVAKLEVSVAPDGSLRSTIIITAGGGASAPYRRADALKNPSDLRSPALFGSFVIGGMLDSPAEVVDAERTDRPVTIRLRMRKNEFLLPIHRQQTLIADVVPLALPVTTGALRAGAPGRFREEIAISIPAGFTVALPKAIAEDRPFGGYQSQAKIEADRLIVLRELLLRQESASGFDATDVESFWKIVRDDQQRQFVLRRTDRTDSSEWVRSVPVALANTYGVTAIQQREYEAARALFERVIAANPKDAYAWNNLGRALVALGDLEAAQRAYRQQIAINPADNFAYNNLGLIEERRGDWAAAIEDFRKQLEVSPNDTHAAANLPRALIHAYRWSEADSAASKVLERDGNNTQQKLYRAVARVCAGGAKDVVQEMNSALGAKPSAAQMNDVAYYLTECGKGIEQAEAYGRKALDQIESAAPANGTMSSQISRQVSFANYLDTYGWLLFKQEKFEQAAGLIAASTELAPRADAFSHLAQVELKLGQESQALRHWRQAIFLEPGTLADVPEPMRAPLQSIAPLSLDRLWYPLPSISVEEVAGGLRSDQACYFFVNANADGSVGQVRELDQGDSTAKLLLPAVRHLTFPPVEADGRAVATVRIVKVTGNSDGSASAAHSIATEVVSLAGDLSPGEFPLPSTATASPSPAINGVVPPRQVWSPKPEYSEEARRMRLEGTVVVRCVINAEGSPHNCRVDEPLGLGLDENAVAAVSGWRFEPGTKDGKPVSVESRFAIQFRIAGNEGAPSAWHLARVVFSPPIGASSPRIRQTAEIRVAQGEGRASATVEFEVDAHGNASNVRVAETSNDPWAAEVVAALRKWKFTPATIYDQPIAAHCTMEFVRGH